jgi:hypothetical protein
MSLRANLLFAAAVAGIVALSFHHDRAASRDIATGAFDRINAHGIADVEVHVGGPHGVHVSGPKREIERLRIAAKDGELSIGTAPGSWLHGWRFGWGDHERTVVTVSVPMLRAVANSGPGDIDIAAIEANEIGITVSGPGDIDIAGRAGRARIKIDGPGDVDGHDLTVRDAAIDVSGPGDVKLTATGTAAVAVSGPGDVEIKGNPRCTVTKRGPGDVDCG